VFKRFQIGPHVAEEHAHTEFIFIWENCFMKIIVGLLLSFTLMSSNALADPYCDFHPEATGCHSPGDSYCSFNPSANGCHAEGDSFCSFNPSAYGCHSPGDSYCSFNPSDEGCHTHN